MCSGLGFGRSWTHMYGQSVCSAQDDAKIGYSSLRKTGVAIYFKTSDCLRFGSKRDEGE